MARLNLHFITLFPETIDVWLRTGILGRAKEKELFSVELHSLRQFATDRHHTVDDVSYGGGGGMVLKIEPLVAAIEQIQSRFPKERFQILCPSPAGTPISHSLVLKTVQSGQNFIFVCGRYEGIDQRFIDHFVDLEFSLGDFVMTAGELPALAFADSMTRQLEGTLGNPKGAQVESFLLCDKNESRPLLEFPQYTRPASFRGLAVPEELLSGDHGRIQKWRMDRAKEKTLRVRPDMLTSEHS